MVDLVAGSGSPGFDRAEGRPRTEDCRNEDRGFRSRLRRRPARRSRRPSHARPPLRPPARPRAAEPSPRAAWAPSPRLAPQQEQRVGADQRNFLAHGRKGFQLCPPVGSQEPLVVSIHQLAEPPVGLRRQAEISHPLDPFDWGGNGPDPLSLRSGGDAVGMVLDGSPPVPRPELTPPRPPPRAADTPRRAPCGPASSPCPAFCGWPSRGRRSRGRSRRRRCPSPCPSTGRASAPGRAP